MLIDVQGYFADEPMGLEFTGLAGPCRVLDTRPGSEGYIPRLDPGMGGPAPLEAGSTRALPLAATVRCGSFPESAGAVSLRITAYPEGEGLGYLSLWPTGANKPGTSVLNALDGQPVSNAAIVPNILGSLEVFTAGRTHLTVDVLGYWLPSVRYLWR